VASAEPAAVQETAVAAVPAASGTTAPSRAASGPVITSRAPPPVRRADLVWQDMAGYAGRRVRLWTRHNPARNVEVLAVNDDSIRITTRLGGGNAEYTVQRASFLRARALR